MTLRAGRDDDAASFIALIGACWAEYPGCVMDLDGEVPELRALATYYARPGGALWAAEQDGAVIGMVATRPLEGGAWELCKMYVAASARGAGVAQTLIDAAESHASARGATEMRLWTDTRFDRAHRFYEKSSYVRRGALRVLGDKSNSIEFPYAKPLTGVAIWELDAAAAVSAIGCLAALLKACVDGGASVSFLPPLDPSVATAFWQRAASAVATDGRVLLAAWADGTLAGTVTIDCDMPQNQTHRADIAKVLVHPAARRRGIARALMARAEAAARARNRDLLVLDTKEGDAAEPLYRSLGWHEAGRIPGFALEPDGSRAATILFWKNI
jgi:GNAT superfamily N-acetyltransferase